MITCTPLVARLLSQPHSVCLDGLSKASMRSRVSPLLARSALWSASDLRSSSSIGPPSRLDSPSWPYRFICRASQGSANSASGCYGYFWLDNVHCRSVGNRNGILAISRVLRDSGLPERATVATLPRPSVSSYGRDLPRSSVRMSLSLDSMDSAGQLRITRWRLAGYYDKAAWTV
ncbi:hypothetical protein BV20DRAFT_144311 [Pilatotrama ljubarskyi]|nr:hypothetical protein BV20DRAFT_144311 [Pilatotrama ljubarskyi]